MSRPENHHINNGLTKSIRRQTRNTILSLESVERRELMAAPAMDALAQVNVPAGKSLFLPLTSTTSDQSKVTYSVASSNEAVKSTVLSGGTFVNLSVGGYGDMTFKLFDELAPDTVDKIKTLVNAGFYDGLLFHRVIKGFMIQGGDPLGNGTGGPGFTFPDEFNQKALFTGVGQLAMANSGKDTNGSQFFITSGPQRELDNNHTIFGQLVRGFDVLNKIQNVSTLPSDAPATPVVITKAQVVEGDDEAVLLIEAPPTETGTQLIVTAMASDGQFSQQAVPVSVVADTYNTPPILGKLADVTSRVNTPVTFQLNASDLENDSLESRLVATSNADKVDISINGSTVTITPKKDFVGTVQLLAEVRQSGSVARGSTPDAWDRQAFRYSVTPPPIAMTAVNAQLMEGQSTGERVLAWFTDNENTAGTTSQYGASIDWGDGTYSVGKVRTRLGGGFEIVGSHTYANEGTYKTNVVIGDPSNDMSAINVKSTVSGQIVATDAPLAARGVSPANVVAGQSWTGLLATFTDTNPASPVSDYTAIIRWGDGSIEHASQIVKNAAGQIEVYGEHTYANAGRKVAQTLIRDKGTAATTAVSPIQIASAKGITPQPSPTTPTTPVETPVTPPPVTPVLPPTAEATPSADGELGPQTSGRLAASSDTGISYSDGITRINKPVFEGQTAPGASVQLKARKISASAGDLIDLGTAKAGEDGKWQLLAMPTLPDSQYVVELTVTRGTETFTKTLMGGGTGSGTALVIDTVAPTVTQIGYNQATGQVRVNAEDHGSGLLDNQWSTAGNYRIQSSSGRQVGQVMTPATLRKVSTTSFPKATYNIVLDRGFGPRPKKVLVQINRENLTDVAGNPTDAQVSYVVANSKIIRQLPKGVAATIQNSRNDTSIANQILNFLLPSGMRSKRF